MIDKIITQYSQEVVKKGKKRLPEEIIMISFFERYHWSYDEYMNTPTYVIDLILAKDDVDYRLSQMKDGN